MVSCTHTLLEYWTHKLLINNLMFSHYLVAICEKEQPCIVTLLEDENIKLLINWYLQESYFKNLGERKYMLNISIYFNASTAFVVIKCWNLWHEHFINPLTAKSSHKATCSKCSCRETHNTSLNDCITYFDLNVFINSNENWIKLPTCGINGELHPHFVSRDISFGFPYSGQLLHEVESGKYSQSLCPRETSTATGQDSSELQTCVWSQAQCKLYLILITVFRDAIGTSMIWTFSILGSRSPILTFHSVWLVLEAAWLYELTSSGVPRKLTHL
jgi:hypothetical protein